MTYSRQRLALRTLIICALSVTEYVTSENLAETTNDLSNRFICVQVKRGNLKFSDSKQGRSQTSEQEEARFERRRCEPLGECGGMPPPEKLEIYKLINALVSISHGIFLQKSQFWASVEVHFLIA